MAEYQALNTCSDASDTRSDSQSMTDSKYAKVIFTEIKDVFAEEEEVEARIYSSIDMNDDDVIQVQRVGLKDIVLMKKKVKDIPKTRESEFGELVVTFDLKQGDMDEVKSDDFFQFCYLLNGSQEVCGASTPFRFRKRGEEVDDELDEDFLVVKSPEAHLRDQVTTLVTLKTGLETEKTELERILKELDAKLKTKETELSDQKLYIKDMNDKLQKKLEQIAEILRHKEEMKIDFERRSVDLNNQMTVIVEDRDQMSQVLESTKLALNETNDNLMAVKTERQELKSRLSAITEQNVVNSRRSGQLEMALAETKMERDRLREELERKSREWDNKVDDRRMLEMKINEQKVIIDDMRSKMSLIEAKEELLRTQLATELSSKRDSAEEVTQLQESVRQLTKLNEELAEKNDILMREVLEEDKARLKHKVVMKTMHEDMDQMRDNEKQMEVRAEEMRKRLESAAEEYRKCFKRLEKMEDKHKKFKNKVKHYFDTKSKKSSEERNQMIRELVAEEPEVQSESTDSEVQSAATHPKAPITPTTSRAPEPEEQYSSGDHKESLPCVVCGSLLDGRRELVAHLEERHSQRLCPMCSLPFDSRVSGHEDYFRMHVQNHLETGYPHN